MKYLLILISLTLPYQTLGYSNDGSGQGSGYGSNYFRSESEQECRVIPKNVRTLGITPLVKTEVTWNAVYDNCDSSSTFQRVSWVGSVIERRPCHGVTVDTNDKLYNVTLIDRKGNKRQEAVILKNYNYITTYNNGNFNYIECGIISNGKCKGDEWTGVGIYQADDQKGCGKNGVRGAQALIRNVKVIGKCSTKCSLGRSTVSYRNGINNKGRS